MAIRQRKSVSSSCMLLVLCFSDAAGASERWVFTSLWGQKVAVSRGQGPAEYSLAVSDVIHRVAACEAKKYRVCFVTTSLSVAIPSDPPEDGDRWSENGAAFRVESILREIDLLGVSDGPIFVIRVDHHLNEKLDVQTVRRHRLYFSYRNGLLGFEQLVDGENSPLFLASRLPSLGSDSFGSE